MKHRMVFGLALTVLSGALTAAPSDFARGLVLMPEDGAPVQHVLLPADVYRWVVRDDLGDLRVYDPAGEEIAHALQRPSGTEEYTAWQVLPMFRLPAVDPEAGDSAGVNIELADGGAVVAVHGGRPRGTPGQRYLLDATAYRQPLVELKFSWRGDGDVVTQVMVEAADDLDDFRELVASASLADLTAGAERVRLDRLALPGPTRAKYLRVSRMAGRDLDFDQIEVRSRETRAPVRQWALLDGVVVDEGLEFDTGGRYPVDRISVELDRPSYLLEATISSRARPDRPWNDRGTHTFYRVMVNGVEARSDPLKFASPYHRYWRVEPLDDDAAAEPRLKVGWAPDRLVFANPGQGPYTLAYGSGAIAGRQWPMADLLRRLDPSRTLGDVPMATAGSPEMLGGPERLEPLPEPVDWKTVTLWAVLVLGVAVVAGLAIRLLRQ